MVASDHYTLVILAAERESSFPSRTYVYEQPRSASQLVELGLIEQLGLDRSRVSDVQINLIDPDFLSESPSTITAAKLAFGLDATWVPNPRFNGPDFIPTGATPVTFDLHLESGKLTAVVLEDGTALPLTRGQQKVATDILDAGVHHYSLINGSTQPAVGLIGKIAAHFHRSAPELA